MELTCLLGITCYPLTQHRKFSPRTVCQCFRKTPTLTPVRGNTFLFLGQISRDMNSSWCSVKFIFGSLDVPLSLSTEFNLVKLPCLIPVYLCLNLCIKSAFPLCIECFKLAGTSFTFKHLYFDGSMLILFIS